MVETAPRIAMVAGEASGDQLGAELIGALRERWPGAEIQGVGGARMRAAGCDTWHDCEELAVMGIAEVLRHLPRLLRLKRALTRRIMAWRPDLFLGIDAPDFNLRLARRLHAGGLRTAHLVSPSVWAWRPGRAKTIGRAVDLMLCLLPFEPDFYAEHGIDARFVGHPLADRMPRQPDRAAARAELGLAPAVTTVAVLPGSRGVELDQLGVDFARAIGLLHADAPEWKFVAPMATPALARRFAALLDEHAAGADVQLIDGRSHAVLAAADVALLASGTAALEALLCKRPMVVAYRLGGLTRAIVGGLGLLRVDRFSLPNLLAGKDLVPELIQDAVTPAALATALRGELARADDVALRDEFDRIHATLARDSSHTAAAAIAELLERAE